MSEPPPLQRETAPEDRIPISEKIGFGLGFLGQTGSTNTAMGMINMIYNMILGVSPALLSTAGFIVSIATMFIEPVLGHFSDNFRSRWGRRRPLMAVAAAPMVLMMIAMYAFPKGLNEHGLFIWLLVTMPLMHLMVAIYNPALVALGIEATGDYHERIRLQRIVMLVIFGFAISKEWIFPVVQLPRFGNPIHGMHVLLSGLAVILLAAAFAPLFLCPEKKYATHTKHLAKTSFFTNLYEARKNKPFLIILSIKFFTFFCYTTVGALGIYMNNYYVFGGDLKRASWVYAGLGTSYSIAACTSFFIYPLIIKRLGKKETLQVAASVLLFGCFCKLFVYQPKYPWLQLIVLMCNGASVQGINFVIGTMMGDIFDYDETLSGKRREALYMTVMGWFEKAGTTVAGLIAGFLLVWIGFNAKNKFGVQSNHTLQLMKFFYILCPTVGGIFALLAIRGYDITETRAYAIRDELKRRHAQLSPVTNQPGTSDAEIAAEDETLMNEPKG